MKAVKTIMPLKEAIKQANEKYREDRVNELQRIRRKKKKEECEK